MIYSIKRVLALCLCLLTFAVNANTNTSEEEQYADQGGFHWELDLGLLVSQRKILVESLIEDDGVDLNAVISGGVYFDNFFAEFAPFSGRPFTAGYTLYRKETRQLNIIAESNFYEISEEAQESGNLLDGINEREDSMEVGVEYFGIYKKYDFRVKLLHDGLGRHKGTIGSLELSRPIFTRHVMFVPGFTLAYYDNNATDYYYGVSKDEVTPSRSAYQADSAWIATARLYVERPMGDDWSFIGAASYSFVSNEIMDSPIVAHNQNPYSISVGVLWTF